MDHSRTPPPLFGIRLTERQKRILRQLYRRSMTVAGCAALVLSLLLQAVHVGVDGLRRFAETLAFSGIVSEASADPPPPDGDLSLFLSPNPGEPPRGSYSSSSAEAEPDSPADDATAEDASPEPPAEDTSNTQVPTPSNGSAIALRDLSAAVPLSLINMTSTLDPDLDKVYRTYLTGAKERNSNEIASSPLVLILHTHSTEAYADEGSDSIPAGFVPRSIDWEESVVAVGTVLTETLENRGIPTIHCTFGHDLEDYDGAYDREKATILSYLEKYPSIRYIFDVHRDSIEQKDGSIVKTAATVNGEPVAQLMFVVGTNERGANHPHWEDNLGYALALQTALSSDYPGLMRAVNLRGPSFNEQYTPFSLLVEVGASGNTLAEAKRTAVLLGNAIADEILG